MFRELRHGFISAHCRCSHRKSLGKPSRCRLTNHHLKCFHSWRMDSSAHTTPLTPKEARKTESFPYRNSPRNCFHRWQMDSSAHTIPVESKTVKENWVAAHSQIAPETAFRGEAWIPQRTETLLTQKQLRKTESLASKKSSSKMFRELTHGFISAHYPCSHRKSLGKRVAVDSQIITENFSTPPVDLETVKQNWVAGLSEIVTENVSRGHAWIHKHTLPLFTQKESRKTESLPTKKSSLKMFPELTHGFINAHYPFDTERVQENWVPAHSQIAPETAFRGDAWSPQRTQPL
jgi:hypothetical protein